MNNQERKERIRDRGCREIIHDDGGKHSESKPRPKRPQPRPEGQVTTRPLRCEPAADDLEREVNEDGDREIFFAQALFDVFQGSDGFVGGEADLGA